MAVVGGAPSTIVVLLACLVVQIGFGGYGIGACDTHTLLGGGWDTRSFAQLCPVGSPLFTRKHPHTFPLL